MNYRNAKDTKDFIDNLPELIGNNEENFKAYLITLTFKDTFKDPPKQVYQNFLGRLYLQLNKFTVNRHSLKKNHQKYSGFITIPEPSYSESKMHRNPHIHAILLIRKTQLEKFLSACVTPLKLKFSKRKEAFEPAHDLLDSFLQKLNSTLKVYSSDVREIYDVRGACEYIGKKLYKIPKREINYKHKDLRRSEGFQRTYQSDKNLENHNICYDDIFVFFPIPKHK